jgi:galactokinase
MNSFESKLHAAGMSAGESAAKGMLLEKLTRRLREMRGRGDEHACAFFVPGRIEVLGKHTDYAGGRSIVCAMERGICLVADARADAQVRLLDWERKSEARVALDAEEKTARGDWSEYAAVVARRFSRDFPGSRIGADIVFASDLSRAAGMSSSSALIIGIFMAIAEVNSLAQSESYRAHIRSREDLAGYLAAVESGAEFAAFSGGRGVGTLGGSEDHVAILCSRAGFLKQYSYCPVKLEREIQAPKDFTFVIGSSGVKADKTGNALLAYNRISLAARKILDLWRSATGRSDGSLADALIANVDALERLRRIVSESGDAEFSSELLLKRFDQFVEESIAVVPAAAESFARMDLMAIGALVDRSQFLAEKMLGNQTAETIELARSARALGAAAASAFGAGFGGSVWALVSTSDAEEFRNKWAARYREKFPERVGASQFFITGAGPGLTQMEVASSA